MASIYTRDNFSISMQKASIKASIARGKNIYNIFLIINKYKYKYTMYIIFLSFNFSFESNAKYGTYVVSLHHHICSRQPTTATVGFDVEILRCCFLEQQDDLSPRSWLGTAQC